jgi:hypothetical protein
MIQLSGHTIVISGYTLRRPSASLSSLPRTSHAGTLRGEDEREVDTGSGVKSRRATRGLPQTACGASPRALKLRLQSVEELVLLLSLTAATRLAARRAATRLAAVARPIVARLRHGRRRLPLRGGSATGPLPLRHPALGVVVVGVALLVEQLLPA